MAVFLQIKHPKFFASKRDRLELYPTPHNAWSRSNHALLGGGVLTHRCDHSMTAMNRNGRHAETTFSAYFFLKIKVQKKTSIEKEKE